jgi:hypothetical protein
MYSLLELQEQLYSLCHKCYQADADFVEANEQFELLEDMKKVRFEQIVEKQSGDKTNLREHNARISTEWQEWLKVYAQFRNERNQALLLRDRYRREYLTCQMLMSAIKSELKTIGGQV